MPDEIRVRDSDDIIEVISFGVLKRADMKSTKARLQEIHAKKAINGVLIDTTRVDSVPDTIDIFHALATQSLDFKIAILAVASSPFTEDFSFAETVGVNRGKMIKVFFEREKARKWLGASVE